MIHLGNIPRSWGRPRGPSWLILFDLVYGLPWSLLSVVALACPPLWSLFPSGYMFQLTSGFKKVPRRVAG